MAARRAHNPEVAGSSPAPAIFMCEKPLSSEGLCCLCRRTGAIRKPRNRCFLSDSGSGRGWQRISLYRRGQIFRGARSHWGNGATWPVDFAPEQDDISSNPFSTGLPEGKYKRKRSSIIQILRIVPLGLTDQILASRVFYLMFCSFNGS